LNGERRQFSLHGKTWFLVPLFSALSAETHNDAAQANASKNDSYECSTRQTLFGISCRDGYGIGLSLISSYCSYVFVVIVAL
jgi:hypothetical protein